MSAFTKPSILPTLPCQLPTPSIGSDINPDVVAQEWEAKITTLDADCFAADAIWRDVFAFTGTLRTFYTAANIATWWSRLTSKRQIGNVKLQHKSPRIVRLGEHSTWLEVYYGFEIDTEPAATCRLILSLTLDEHGTWRIWMARTMLDQLKDFPNVDKLDPTSARETNGLHEGLSSGDEHVDCVVVGGGQAGLSVGGRLKALGLSYVVLDKNKQVGDNWKLRYDSATLHTTRASSYLPFDMTFPASEYSKFLTKDELAQGYSAWSEKFNINIWSDTSLVSGEWQARDGKWKLAITRCGQSNTIFATHVVMATGAGGQIPRMPEYPGVEDFEGVIQHSSQYTSAREWKGKAGIVIGTANTGCDVAVDMVNAQCSSVTMVQRSPTYVFGTEYYERLQDILYNDTVPIEVADIAHLTTPTAVARMLSNFNLHARTRAEPERYDGLERAGFKLIRFGDLIHQIYECFGGHYMDMGAVAKITDGSIKIKSDALPVRYTPRGLLFDDGAEIPADAVVLATGFDGNTKSLVRQIFGPSIADQVDDFWGLDSEGELKGAFKPCGHPNLWMIGGTHGQARFYSRFIALSICAAVNGKPLEVYRP